MGHNCFIYRVNTDVTAKWAIMRHNDPFSDPEIAMGFTHDK